MSENNTIFKGDRYLWGVYFLLCLISIVEVYSSSSFLTRRGGDFLGPAMRQISFVLAGTALVVIMHNLHYKWCKLLMAFFGAFIACSYALGRHFRLECE